MYCKSVLPNGIRVVTEAIPYVKSVTLGIWVGTGSRSETAGNRGISHFIEHMLFKGSQKRSAKAIAETIDAVGGQLNAFTGKENTCFYIKVLDTHLELALDVLSDMLLSPRFDPQDIQREREVVLEEIHMYEDTPDEVVHDLHLSKIWAGHPLGRNILGSAAAVETIDAGLIREYYSQFYTPDNIVIAAAGNLTHQQVEELAQRYFGQMAGKRPAPAPQPTVLHTGCTVQHKAIEQIHLCLSTAGVSHFSGDIYTLQIINNILGGGISSRLFQSIREDKGLAYSVYSYQSNYSDGGLFTVYAGTRPANALQVAELIMQNIRQLKETGITAAELGKTKEQLKGGIMLALESSSSRMSRVGKLETTLGKYVTLEDVIRKIDGVTLDQLQQHLSELFNPGSMYLTALGPLTEEIENGLKRL